MLHTLHSTIQRVSDLITEYDEDEDRRRNPNPESHAFVQKLKVILNSESEITTQNGATLESDENGVASQSRSSFISQIDVGHSNNDSKVIEALGNHVVLTEIFKCGGYHDLKNFRLVNKQWKEIVNSAIAKRRLWELSFSDRYSVHYSMRNEDLVKFLYCIESCQGSFPLTTLEFTCTDYKNLNSVALLRIYNLIGPNIKHVQFCRFGPLTTYEFQDLLLNKMPNVDHIDAGSIFFMNQEEYIVPIVLPHLKTIRFISDDPYVPFTVLPYYGILLRAATNLMEIQDFWIQLTDLVIHTGKLDCIKKFNFALELETCSALCVQFSNTEPKLTELSITRNYFESMSKPELTLTLELEQSLKTILISSKDTLKHLQCMPCLFPVDFELPKFPNLESLTVRSDMYRDDGGHIGRVFPAGCDVNEIFPSVNTVLLDVDLDERVTLQNFFPGQVFASVKTVVFPYDSQFGVSLKTVFPNASHVKYMNFSTTNGFYFELDNQIESMEFYQCCVADSKQKFELDALFTGLPSHVCRNLLKIHNDCKARDENENVEFVKEFLKLVQPQDYMFRNCEGLRRLKIFFNNSMNYHFRIPQNSNAENVESYNAVISPVSCVYGFSLMPNLEEVIIGYDHYLRNAADIAQVLKPLTEFPYIKLVHEPTVEQY